MEATSINEIGQTPLKDKRGGWISFPFIIGAIMGLSLAAGGWGSNLIVFLIREFNFSNIAAAQSNNVILGCFSLFPIVGAIIADSLFGSFLVISVFSLISFLGMIMLTLASTIHSLRPPPCENGSHLCETPLEHQYAVLYIALTLASLGVGGTCFTLATIGADQFDKPDDQAIFFDWYFFALFVSSAISTTAIIYVEDNVSWGLGFGICAIVNAIGLVLFLAGKCFYRSEKLKGSPFTSIARVIIAAFRRRKISFSGNFQSQDYYYQYGDGSFKIQGSAPMKSLRFLNKVAMITGDDDQLEGSIKQGSWKLCTVEEVEDLKILMRILPLWSTSILLSTTITSFNSLTILQALTMDRLIGPTFKVPAGSFSVFNLVATAVSIFTIDRIILPTWKYLTRKPLMPLQRIGIGHIINIMAMVASALIESRRLHVARTQHLTDKPGSEVPVSVLWLVMPLTLLGVGEGFQFPGQVALYYQEFPRSLKSTSTAMISLLIGIGYYFSTIVTDLVHRTTRWLPNNLNDGRLDNVFWMLAVTGIVNFGYYIICANLFKYRNVTNP